MIWATVSSWSCFCWPYRASPSLSAKNIISLISVLAICWCPCVESSLVLSEVGVCYVQCVLLAELYQPLPCSFCAPRPNLPVTPGVSWLPTFVLQSPIMKKTCFLGVCSERSCRFSSNPSTSSFFSITGRGTDLDYHDVEWLALEMNRDHSVLIELHPSTALKLQHIPPIYSFLCLSAGGNHWPFYCLHNFVFSRMSHSCNQTYVAFSDWLLSLPTVPSVPFHDLMVHLFLGQIMFHFPDIPPCIYPFIY